MILCVRIELLCLQRVEPPLLMLQAPRFKIFNRAFAFRLTTVVPGIEYFPRFPFE